MAKHRIYAYIDNDTFGVLSKFAKSRRWSNSKALEEALSVAILFGKWDDPSLPDGPVIYRDPVNRGSARGKSSRLIGQNLRQ